MIEISISLILARNVVQTTRSLIDMAAVRDNCFGIFDANSSTRQRSMPLEYCPINLSAAQARRLTLPYAFRGNCIQKVMVKPPSTTIVWPVT